MLYATSVISSELLAPAAQTISDAVPVIAGVAIPIMALIIAFRLIPKVIKMFAK